MLSDDQEAYTAEAIAKSEFKNEIFNASVMKTGLHLKVQTWRQGKKELKKGQR